MLPVGHVCWYPPPDMTATCPPCVWWCQASSWCQPWLVQLVVVGCLKSLMDQRKSFLPWENSTKIFQNYMNFWVTEISYQFFLFNSCSYLIVAPYLDILNLVWYFQAVVLTRSRSYCTFVIVTNLLLDISPTEILQKHVGAAEQRGTVIKKMVIKHFLSETLKPGRLFSHIV